MTKEEIVRMALEAGMFDGWSLNDDMLLRFAALITESEREACADIVENANTPDCGGWTTDGIAAAIRARNKS